MPTQFGSSVDFNDPKVVFSSAELPTEQDYDLRWRLIQVLQTTLDLDTLFQHFFDQVAPYVPFDGFTYTVDLLNVNLTFGKKAVHSCSYRLITQQDYLGELTFHKSQRFPERDLAALEGLLNILVFPLRNAIRYRDALTAALADPLTGAGNRAALNRSLQHEIELAKRYEQSMAVLMVDLDHFKAINDSFGHGCGDQVLKKLVAKMRDEIRGSDEVFRYGGEEFVILLSNTRLESARYIAERVRQGIAALEVEQMGRKVPTSVSIGLSMLHPEDTVERLLERADFAMYNAKHQGRNRVKVCEEAAS